MYDSIYSQLTDKQKQIIEEHILSLQDDDPGLFDCSDNDRIARKERGDEVAWYEERQSRGCCGAYDIELETPDGIILLGWNYGH